MTKAQQSGGLQVEEDRPWQETLWTAQRVAWAIMVLLVLAALLGLTGKGGPLATASADAGGARVDYPQITRWESDDEIAIRLPRSASGKVDVELSQSFGRLFEIRSVQPEPSQVEATGSGQRFTFDAAGGGEKLVVFKVRANQPGFGRQVQVRVADSRPARLGITVLP